MFLPLFFIATAWLPALTFSLGYIHCYLTFCSDFWLSLSCLALSFLTHHRCLQIRVHNGSLLTSMASNLHFPSSWEFTLLSICLSVVWWWRTQAPGLLFASYVTFVSVTVCLWLVHTLSKVLLYFQDISTGCCLPDMAFEHRESLHNLTCIGI